MGEYNKIAEKKCRHKKLVTISGSYKSKFVK